MTAAPLGKFDGPTCPGCGCDHLETVARGTRWGKPWRRVECQACGQQFGVDSDERPLKRPSAGPRTVLVYPGCRCPECRSSDVPVTSTRTPIRHHKCRSCGACFKSVDASALGP